MSKTDPTIDEIFKVAEALSRKMHEFNTEKGFDEKVAKAMLNATDPDSKFKADMAIKLSTVMNLMDMFVTYMNKPVRLDGVLQRKMDGSVMLEDIPVPAGSLVEYWKNEKWNLGKLMQDPKTKQPCIVDVINSKVMMDKIEQVRGRIR